MIRIENTEVVGWAAAIRGMRNSWNSWDKSDSRFSCLCMDDKRDCPAEPYIIGENDHGLMMKLARAGSDHAKYRRMIVVYADVTAPLYWWKEYDTYKVGTVANSCSSMHDICLKEFQIGDFSHEKLDGENGEVWEDVKILPSFCTAYFFIQVVCDVLNHYRKKYIETKDKKYWWHIIQLLPTSYNQRRTVMLNYEVLANIYHSRKEHKLDEWRDFCVWIKSLPYSEIITGEVSEMTICDR